MHRAKIVNTNNIAKYLITNENRIQTYLKVTIGIKIVHLTISYPNTIF